MSKKKNTKTYVPIPYTGYPSEMLELGGDNQCRVCALMPNTCGMMEKCHGENPFIYIETKDAKALSQIT